MEMGGTTTERRGSSKPIPYGILKKGLAYHWLAGLLSLVLMFLSDVPAVQLGFTRLAWWLSPWRSFPLTYDLSDYGPQFETDWLMLLLGVLGAAGLFICLAFVIHGLAFLLVVWAHKLRGWPQYWNDVRARLDLPSIWAESARRSWWVWPTSLLIWLLIEQLAMGFVHVGYPVIEGDVFWYPLNLLAVLLLHVRPQTRLLRTNVIQSITLDDLRCTRCGYMLRGLKELRCPECGSEEDRDGKARYGFRWGMTACRPRINRPVLLCFFPLLLLAPVWVPLLVLSLPRMWVPYLPPAIQPSRQVLSRNPDSFPIRLDTVCVVRHGGALAVVRFKPVSAVTARYEVAYWTRESDFGTRPPDRRTSGRVRDSEGPDLPVGPWNFSYSKWSARMIWLTRPDTTYEIQAFEPERFPGDLSWLNSSTQPQSQPSSHASRNR